MTSKQKLRVEDVDENVLNHASDTELKDLLTRAKQVAKRTEHELAEAELEEKKNTLGHITGIVDALEAELEKRAEPEETAWFVPFVKVNEEKRFVLAPFLIPNEVDTQNDVTTEAEIEKALHKFMGEYPQIGLMHKQLLKRNVVRIVEAYMTRGDWDYDGKIVKRGTGMLGLIIVDDDIWGRIQRKELTGFSIKGRARVPRR